MLSVWGKIEHGEGRESERVLFSDRVVRKTSLVRLHLNRALNEVREPYRCLGKSLPGREKSLVQRP